MTWALYLRGTTTAPGTQVFTSTAGTLTAAISMDLWLDYGAPGSVANGVRLIPEVLSGATWLSSGVEPLDRHCLQYRIVGSVNASSDPLFVPILCDWTPMGTDLPAQLGDIRGDCAWQVDFRLVEPIDGGTLASFSWRVRPGWNSSGDACPVGVSEAGGIGILTGVGDPRISEWVKAPAVVETGTPDAYANVARRWYVLAGVSRRAQAEAVELNQNDGLSAALTTGQAYVAMLSQSASAAVTVTKGEAALLASVVAPDIPAGELPIARIIVNYSATMSVIANADITSLCDDGRGIVAADTGLDVIVARLRATVDRQIVLRSVPETITVTDDATTRVYLTSAGEISMTAGSLALADVTAASGSVTTIVDLRTYVEPGAEWVRLGYAGDETAATNQSRARIPYTWNIDRVCAGVATASTGATGATALDIMASGTTIYTGGTDTPSIAAQAIADDDSWPVVTTGAAGEYLRLDTTGVTSGGTRADDIEAQVRVYPLR